MTNDVWNVIGITGESRFVKLLFEPHSGSLIAQFYRDVTDRHGVKTLYLRSTTSKVYRRLFARSDSLTYEDAVISPAGPFVFVNVLEARKDGDSYNGYDWYALQKIKVPDGELIGEISDGQLPGTSAGYRSWVSALHGVASDGNTIYCTIGVPDVQSDNSVKMHYQLAKLNFEKSSFDAVVELDNTFL